MAVVLVFEEDVLRPICGHAPLSGGLEGMQSFYDELKGEWDTYSVDLWFSALFGPCTPFAICQNVVPPPIQGCLNV